MQRYNNSPKKSWTKTRQHTSKASLETPLSKSLYLFEIGFAQKSLTIDHDLFLCFQNFLGPLRRREKQAHYYCRMGQFWWQNRSFAQRKQDRRVRRVSILMDWIFFGNSDAEIPSNWWAYSLILKRYEPYNYIPVKHQLNKESLSFTIKELEWTFELSFEGKGG